MAVYLNHRKGQIWATLQRSTYEYQKNVISRNRRLCMEKSLRINKEGKASALGNWRAELVDSYTNYYESDTYKAKLQTQVLAFRGESSLAFIPQEILFSFLTMSDRDETQQQEEEELMYETRPESEHHSSEDEGEPTKPSTVPSEAVWNQTERLWKLENKMWSSSGEEISPRPGVVRRQTPQIINTVNRESMKGMSSSMFLASPTSALSASLSLSILSRDVESVGALKRSGARFVSYRTIVR